jgi:hypothetical protein
MSGSKSIVGKAAGILNDPMRGAGGGAAGDNGDDSPALRVNATIVTK